MIIIYIIKLLCSDGRKEMIDNCLLNDGSRNFIRQKRCCFCSVPSPQDSTDSFSETIWTNAKNAFWGTKLLIVFYTLAL